MANLRYDYYLRLEPHVARRDFQAGIAATIHDPVWFLCRQWQMAEFQGENASTPVRVTYHATHTPLLPSAVDPRDPTQIPAETIIESEPYSWWTLGRRIRYGARFVANHSLEIDDGDSLRLLPPPYAEFEGAPDGLALWKRGAVPAAAYPEIPVAEPHRQAWSSSQLVYNATFDNAERALDVSRHMGGAVDWYSADGSAVAELAPEPEVLPDGRDVFPAQVEYPGAPKSRWWEIEDADTDIAGYPPDRSQFPTMLLVDLMVSHSDDWFTFPVSTQIGHIVTLHHVIVHDGFDDDYVLTFINSDEWSVFKTSGLRDTSLVVWPTALTPLKGNPIEHVQFGIDEDANLLWAVERRLNGRDVQAGAGVPPDGSASNHLRTVDTSAPKTYRYVPGSGALPFWQPYSLEEGETGRTFRHAIFDDAVFPNVNHLPKPQASVLQVEEAVHEIETGAVPSNGLEIERCWMLARDTAGNPLLWIQRQRMPLRSPPARVVRFDVFEEIVPE